MSGVFEMRGDLEIGAEVVGCGMNRAEFEGGRSSANLNLDGVFGRIREDEVI